MEILDSLGYKACPGVLINMYDACRYSYAVHDAQARTRQLQMNEISILDSIMDSEENTASAETTFLRHDYVLCG